jgi:predicted transcriptional regulator
VEQTSIDFATRARRDDPQTSKDAAASVNQFGNEAHQTILRAIVIHGPMTFYEIAHHTGLRPDQVWRRLSELHKMGLIEPLMEDVMSPDGYSWIGTIPVTRRGDTGRMCRVWKLREE